MASRLAVAFIGLAVCLLSLQSCASSSKGSDEEITVSAAVSLKEAFTEIGREFESAHPGAKVTFNFGASGVLSRQIEEQAPVDVFASASADQIENLDGKHLLASDTVQEFARNKLVMIFPSGDKEINFERLTTLRRIAIGDPATVPCGEYARDAMVRAGIYNTLWSEHKLVLAENVRQVLAYVDSGDVDVGIAYSTDVPMSHGSAVCEPVPDKYTESIVYPIALVRSSTHAKLGKEFIDMVVSPKGQHILKARGFQG